MHRHDGCSLIDNHKGLSHSVIGGIVGLVDSRLAANRNADGSALWSINNYHLSILGDQFTPIPSDVPEPVTYVLAGAPGLGCWRSCAELRYASEPPDEVHFGGRLAILE